MQPIEQFFKPKGVAVIGASASPDKLSYGILANLLKYGYQGEVYPVNPKTNQILGKACYPSILDVPDPVELAVIVLPARLIPQTINDCGVRGIRAVIVISGGFKEVGEQGSVLEQEVLRNARQHGIRLVGPNCVGIVDLYSGLNTTFINGLPPKGNIAFVSQSGAVCGGAVDYLLDKGMGFSHFISLGNEVDVTETDMIKYLASDENAKVIAVYAESIQNGSRFIEVCKEVTRKKPVVLIKSGRTEAGARAVSSHTGSLAGSGAAYQAAFRQSGVVVAETLEDLYAIASGFEMLQLPKGNRVVIVTNAGGPAALASDALDLQQMCLAEMSERTKSAIRAHVNPAAQVDNPIDMLGGAMPDEYRIALDHAMADPQVDAAIAILVPTALVPAAEVALVIGEMAHRSAKPIVACMMGHASLLEANRVLQKYHVPTFAFPEQCAIVLGKMAAYHRYRQSRQDSSKPFLAVAPQATSLLALADSAVLGETQTRPLLAAYGIPLVPAETASSQDEAAHKAAVVGFPVVMKIISPDILHKSDSGGIRLGIHNEQEAWNSYQQIMDSVREHHPAARLYGVLVEPMAPAGIEVIVGMKRDPNFGPLLMFGLGGIYVELFKDIAFRVAPISLVEAEKMIMETAAGTLLQGTRGAQPSDLHAVAEVIQKIGDLAINHPGVAEIEINPLLALPHGVLALDARAILEKSANQ
ncbi:MAG: acetate--CoA ligase family protein [Anaerolineae bacterium]|nr:acetate--CoA ligase family protein [Anaerolineae bacterium]